MESPSALAWRSLVTGAALPAMLVQARFEDEVLSHPAREGSERWGFDVERCALDLGSGGEFYAGILGTMAEADGSWLWAWANPSLSGDVVELATAVRDRVAEWGQPTPLDDDVNRDVGVLEAAVVGAWFSTSEGYYVVPAGEGATLVLLVQDEELGKRRIPYERFPMVVMRIISELPVEHRMLIEEWRESEPAGARFSDETDGSVVVAFEDLPAGPDGRPDPAEGARFRVEFDHLERIAGITGTVGPGDGAP
ncbi:DUF6882 domain-containing protein [Patulibacter americanus]|uniref:DUF6882 domain-containing protein n=1 Tax=Patulibacter americanus TaxID=588672 RepID=UPI0003B346DB|nr:DUF6882 domain-containing protein [Patulibacter americanus]